MGAPTASLPELRAILRWRVNRGLTWWDLADHALFCSIFWRNVPQTATALQRLALALARWSSWSEFDQDHEWQIVFTEGNIHIVATRVFEAGDLVRGLAGFRAELMPGENVEHFEGRFDYFCKGNLNMFILFRETFGPAGLIEHRFDANCELSLLEDGTLQVKVKYTQTKNHLTKSFRH